MGVLGETGEIVRATAEETTGSDQEEEMVAVPTGTEISAANKLQFHRCVK